MNTSTAITIFILGTSVISLFAFFMVMFVAIQKRKQQAFQNELMQSRLEVQEQTFKYLSEEIHDNVGAALSLVKLHLYKIAQKNTDDAVQKDANTGTELLTKAIADLRAMSHSMNNGMVTNMGLHDITQKELNYVASAKNIQCNFETDGEPHPLGEDRELLAFRIIQESVANAIKHAQPDTINVSIDYTPAICTIKITDNGKGFNTAELSNTGLGLNNMQVRAKFLKGKINITSSEEKGTTIQLDIPYDNKQTN